MQPFGLGLSLAFMTDVAKNPTHTPVIGGAWVLFALSLLATLMSLQTAQFGLRKAMRQVDAGGPLGDRPGGWAATLTHVLNGVSSGALVSGVVMLVWFVLVNIGGS